MVKTYLIILAVVFVAGLAVGPGYLVYCHFFSGSSVGEFPVFEKDITSVAVGGMTSISGGQAQWQTPITIHLSPEMNPIALNVAAQIARSGRTGASSSQTARYTTELKLGDKLIWQEEFTMSPSETSKKDKKKLSLGTTGTFSTTHKRIKTFSVTEAGDYVLDVKEEGDSLTVAGMTVKVRSNVIAAKKAIVIPGFVVCVGSLVGLLILSKKNENAR